MTNTPRLGAPDPGGVRGARFLAGEKAGQEPLRGDPVTLRWTLTGVRAKESLFVPVWVAGQGGFRTPTRGLEPKLGTALSKTPLFHVSG